MKRYILFITNHKPILFVLFALSMIGALLGIIRLQLNTDFSLFTTQGSVYEDRLMDMESVFGSGDQIVLMVETDDLDSTDIATWRDIQGYLEDMDQVKAVNGPTPEELNVNGTSVPITSVPIDQLELIWAAQGDFGTVVIEDSTYYGLFTVLLHEDFHRVDLQELEAFLIDEDVTFYLAGETYNQLKVVDYILDILFFLPPLAVLIILFVFFLQLGGIKPTMLSVLPAIVASAWTFGLIGWLGNEVSIMTAIVPVFIIVIGSADGLHFITHVQEARARQEDITTALANTLNIVGVPMIITTLTSMAGFLSLLSMKTDSVVDLAVFAAVGIFLAGLATWFVIPLVLSTGINIQPKKAHRLSFDLSGPLRRMWGVPAIVVSVVLVLLGVVFFSNISNEFDMLSVYKDRTEVAQSATKVQEIKGGSVPLYILYEADDVVTMDVKAEIETMLARLESEELIDGSLNPFAILERVYAQDVPGGIPNNFILDFVYTNVKNSGQTPIEEFINTDAGLIRIAVFPRDMNNDTLAEIESVVQDESDSASVTGLQYLLRDLNVQLDGMQFRSILLAVGIVLVMLMVSLKSIKLAMISIVPILITIVSIYGVMGLVGIPLNVTTVVIFSIAIGVGIDYAVHFSSVYRHFHVKKTTAKQALEQTYQLVSRPVLANAVGIALGLSVLLASPLMIHTYVSSLMWIAMLVSVIMTLTLIPTMLSVTHRKKPIKQK